MQQWGVTPVPGLSGGVDANRYFGSLDQLRALAIGGMPLVPPEPPPDPFRHSYLGGDS
jgi:hypothetical protein